MTPFHDGVQGAVGGPPCPRHPGCAQTWGTFSPGDLEHDIGRSRWLSEQCLPQFLACRDGPETFNKCYGNIKQETDKGRWGWCLLFT